LNCFDRALELHTRLFGTVVHPSVAGDLHNKGTLLCSQGDHKNGIQMLLKALQIDLQVHGENHPEVSYDCRTIAGVYLSSKDPDKARRFAQRALSVDKATKVENALAKGENYLCLGVASIMKHQFIRAVKELSNSVQVLEKYYQSEQGEILDIARTYLQFAKTKS
jgi:Tfp pilus assembly protein PilF